MRLDASCCLIPHQNAQNVNSTLLYIDERSIHRKAWLKFAEVSGEPRSGAFADCRYAESPVKIAGRSTSYLKRPNKAQWENLDLVHFKEGAKEVRRPSFEALPNLVEIRLRPPAAGKRGKEMIWRGEFGSLYTPRRTRMRRLENLDVGELKDAPNSLRLGGSSENADRF